jgi:hypothetical protein
VIHADHAIDDSVAKSSLTQTKACRRHCCRRRAFVWLRLLNTDGDARQHDADGGSVNYRRRIIHRAAIDYWGRRIIAATTPARSAAAVVTATVVTATVVVAVWLGAGRCDKRPEYKKGGECEPCRKSRQQMTF